MLRVAASFASSNIGSTLQNWPVSSSNRPSSDSLSFALHRDGTLRQVPVPFQPCLLLFSLSSKGCIRR
jgi:hypothetical protein